MKRLIVSYNIFRACKFGRIKSLIKAIEIMLYINK